MPRGTFRNIEAALVQCLVSQTQHLVDTMTSLFARAWKKKRRPFAYEVFGATLLTSVGLMTIILL